MKETKEKLSFSSKVRTGWNKFRSFITLEDQQKGRRKLYSSLWAVVFGLVVASIFFMIHQSMEGRSAGPFDFVIKLWNYSFIDKNIKFDFPTFFVIFGFTGLAVSIGFKVGLFNIGISGQMLLPAILVFSFIAKARNFNVDAGFLWLAIILFIIVGFATGAIAGLLKAYCKIHEVISTIFINWIVAFISGWLFSLNGKMFNPESYSPTTIGSARIAIENAVKYQFVYFGIGMFVLTAIVLFVIYNFTTLGYKINMVGKNPSNAKYIGLNEKMLTIIVMGFSGALAGFAGFYYIIIKEGWIVDSFGSNPIAIGFESIAVSLIALNHPIGITLSGFFYSMIYTTRDLFAIKDKLTKDFFPIITGIIVFMAALAIMLYKFKPLGFMWKYGTLWIKKEYWKEYGSYMKTKNAKYREYVKALNEEKRRNRKLKKEFASIKEEYQKWVDCKITSLKSASDDTIMSIYDEMSKKKFEYLKKYSDFGLNNLKTLKNQYKAEKHERKIQYITKRDLIYTSHWDKVKENWAKKRDMKKSNQASKGGE
nr:putative polytopic protein [Mycoplasmopsis fermentans]